MTCRAWLPGAAYMALAIPIAGTSRNVEQKKLRTKVRVSALAE